MKTPTNTYLLWLCLLSAMLIGCSNPVSQTIKHDTNSTSPLKTHAKHQLYQQLTEWQGVPYKLGGTSKKGIDCSAFVQKTFIDRFGFLLPRTTLQQAQFGTAISKDKLQAGDLIFFKTGFRSYHVGMYIENHQFLHASTSQGVTLSSLKNSYWQKAYWQARRIEQLN
ncbi:NlpC/P60 family protein [Pseudoalteromonas sp. G4]|nr:NlpC/P60 family protein [Pseudoalteromonas sp. G4]MDE3272546.1 NlpC/P60 family protein [Pseudoalteromonas sp. G4]